MHLLILRNLSTTRRNQIDFLGSSEWENIFINFDSLVRFIRNIYSTFENNIGYTAQRMDAEIRLTYDAIISVANFFLFTNTMLPRAYRTIKFYFLILQVVFLRNTLYDSLKYRIDKHCFKSCKHLLMRFHTNKGKYLETYIYKDQLKSSSAVQDILIECNQRRFIFQNIPLSDPRISSIGVPLLGSDWSKNLQQQIWCHPMTFSAFGLFSPHSYIFINSTD